MFTEFSYRNTGLPLNTYLQDFGRMKITNKKEASLKFNGPGLRNLAVTDPYMHDGRFRTLEAVLNHYATGLPSRTTSDSSIALGISLSPVERGNYIAFLRTLTYSSFLKANRFATLQ